MKPVPILVLILAMAEGVAAQQEAVDYAREVKPILRERCYACHGALKQESGLRVDTAALMHQGGDSGAAVMPGDVEGSLLIERIRADEGSRMPPEGSPLTSEQIALISSWITSGAKGPADEQPEEDPDQHWAFQTPRRPVVPESPASGPSGSRAAASPIDAFVGRQRASAGIEPLPLADKATLLRRVYLDLIGLPPTAEEIEAFLDDDSPLAYERTVDRLLESPQHGERWGRHWMDVWRYSDWYGRRSVPDVMNSYPMIWRWRDWIVRSINENKPYDQMIVEMLAADELMPDDQNNLVATGFLVRSWFKWNYETWKKDLVEHTGKAFLGLTLNCAQCHDHKYDPLTQEEYFRFRAFFEPLELRHDRMPGEPDPGPFVKYVYGQPYGPIGSGMVRVFDEYLDAETYMFSKGDARLRIEGRPPVSPGAPAVIGGDQLATTQIVLPITAAYPGMKEFIREEERAKLRAAVAEAEKELAAQQKAFAAAPQQQRKELRVAERELRAARKRVTRFLAAGQPGTEAASQMVLAGQQSLRLDAKVGRRALAHTLPGIDALASNGTVSYLVEIVKDGHTNLQLALDIANGATGAFVAFEGGNIKTYTPGGFNEFVAGTYDPASGKNRFRVEMKLDLEHDQYLLTVTSLVDNSVLVDAAPAALNGWRPQTNGKRGLFLDCRPGTEAIYDDLCFAQSDGTPLLKYDFEPPSFTEGQEVAEAALVPGGAPWIVTTYCQSPATSQITSAVTDHPVVRQATERWVAARNALQVPVLNLTAAEARLAAAQSALASLEKRIEADSVRYSTGLLAEDRQAEPEVRTLIHAACHSEREAALAAAKAKLAAAEAALASAEVQAEAAKPNGQAAIDTAAQAQQAAEKQRTEADAAVRAAAAELAKDLGEYTPLSPKYSQITSGRRAVLAQWIANKANPLTARVAVNHIWLRHFGQGLVDTPQDFGRNGSRPTHPELLDWLACELMDSGWSMKHIHRLIVTSQTYQLASMTPRSQIAANDPWAASVAADPDNRTYWRFPATRMQAEVVRDSLLAVAGELDRTMGGQEIEQKQGMTSRRRSIYFAHHGEEKMEFLELFDAANPSDCYRRTTSVQPQQALALTNSEITKTLSRELAKKLWAKAVATESVVSATAGAPASDVPHRFVRTAFLQVLNREPRPQELAASVEFLTQQAERLRAADGAAAEMNPDERARGNLVHALMNHNDFVTVR